MKTAILKTNLWDDDEFYELNIDTKLLYLLLLSSPERGVSDIYAVTDRILTARSGLAQKQLEICKQQLQDRGLVLFCGKFVRLTSAAYVLPKKGRFTAKALEREYDDVPVEILAALTPPPEVKDNSPLIVKDIKRTIHKDKDRDKDRDKDKDVDKSIAPKFGNKEINSLFDTWEEVVGYKLQANRQKNRNACNNLIRKFDVEGVVKLIYGAARASEDRFGPRISDFISLQAKSDELMAWGRRQTSAGGSKPRVVSV